MKNTKPRRAHRRNRSLALESIEPRRLLAFGAELVADVDDTPRSPATYPQGITEFNGAIVYSAQIAATGNELADEAGAATSGRVD